MNAVRVLLEGRVQGVGFRWHTRLEARAIGVSGWVRNLEDGSVEAHLEGDADRVAELLEWLKSGPSGARVDECHVKPSQAMRNQGFEIR